MTRSQDVITLEGAQAVVAAAITEADRMDVSVVIAVVDPSGEQVAFARMDGSPLLSVGVAADKAWTAAAFGKPSQWWAEAIEGDPELGALTEGRRLLPVGGGVPLLVGGTVVGAVGVSGASSEQDRLIAESGAAAVG